MKAAMKKKILLVFGFVFCCLFYFNSCGLESYIYLNAPTVTHNFPTYETNYDYLYFEFTTNERSQNDAFQGTAIYYKIYNNYTTMASQVSSISSLSSSSTNESAAAAKMIDSFGYKQLGLKNANGNGIAKTPLIDAKGVNQRVYIRLTNYQDSEDFKAVVKVKNDDGNSDYTELGIPVRTGNRYTFDFGRRDSMKWGDVSEYNVLPEENDALADVNYSSTFSDEDGNKWYVNLYAVSVGMSEDFVTYYSNVLHLGAVPIDASIEDN